MNATEQLVYQWLKEHGATEESIVFQAHRSPDFVTNIGKFEVKRTVGRVVNITKNQVKMLETEDVTLLVYLDKSELPLKLSSTEFQEQFTLCVATPSEGKFMQSLDDDIFKELSQIAKEKGISVQELIRAVIIPEWLETRKE